MPYKRRFVKCFTDQVLHFGTTSTSKGEGAHAVLKRNLITSTEDLKTVVENLDLMLINQRHDYLIAAEEAKVRYPMDLKIDVFRNLAAFVTPYALRKILEEYKRLIDEPTVLPACTKAFSTSLGLPCAHIIQERLTSNGLMIEDVHLHWRLERFFIQSDPLRHIRDPEVVRTRGRPMGAENRTRREEVFADSTLREPSQFERVEGEIASQNQEGLNPNIAHVLQRADPAPRRRGRPRGSGRAKSEGDRGGRGGRGRGGRGGRRGGKAVASQQDEAIREDAS